MVTPATSESVGSLYWTTAAGCSLWPELQPAAEDPFCSDTLLPAALELAWAWCELRAFWRRFDRPLPRRAAPLTGLIPAELALYTWKWEQPRPEQKIPIRESPRDRSLAGIRARSVFLLYCLDGMPTAEITA